MPESTKNENVILLRHQFPSSSIGDEFNALQAEVSLVLLPLAFMKSFASLVGCVKQTNYATYKRRERLRERNAREKLLLVGYGVHGYLKTK